MTREIAPVSVGKSNKNPRNAGRIDDKFILYLPCGNPRVREISDDFWRGAAIVLGFAPQPGTVLTMVDNTGIGFIRGAYDNLSQGRRVMLFFNGDAYSFVANYFGGEHTFAMPLSTSPKLFMRLKVERMEE
jgi:hypothetical protein